MESAFVHPCQKCGACCSSYRVSFYWREAEINDSEFAVPEHLWEESSGQWRVLKGTNSKHNPKCQALVGQIGINVGCTIYQNRPSPCRNFQASFEDGTHKVRCDEARLKHGLKPLRREDWL